MTAKVIDQATASAAAKEEFLFVAVKGGSEPALVAYCPPRTNG
jgi:hypothetical protein